MVRTKRINSGAVAAYPTGGESVMFPIPKKFGNAVMRNRARRRIQGVMNEMGLSGGLKIIPSQDVLTMDYDDLKRDVVNLFAEYAKRSA